MRRSARARAGLPAAFAASLDRSLEADPALESDLAPHLELARRALRADGGLRPAGGLLTALTGPGETAASSPARRLPTP